MLEIILAQKIIDIVGQVMGDNGVDKVLVIHISIEKMSLGISKACVWGIHEN
jgi:hypothetical protein